MTYTQQQTAVDDRQAVLVDACLPGETGDKIAGVTKAVTCGNCGADALKAGFTLEFMSRQRFVLVGRRIQAVERPQSDACGEAMCLGCHYPLIVDVRELLRSL